MKLDTGITITTEKIENFPIEIGILEFIRLLVHTPDNIPNEISVFGLDKLLFSLESPEKIKKILYFLFQKIKSYICVQMIVTSEIRSSGNMNSFQYKSRRIYIDNLVKRPFIRGYNPDKLFVSI